MKKARAMYQQFVNRIFEDHIGKKKEVYIDDMLVKSENANNHLDKLR